MNVDPERGHVPLSGAQDDPSVKGRKRSYMSFAHQSIAQRLAQAQQTGRLGNGRPDCHLTDTSLFSPLLRSIPWMMLSAQLVWSVAVMMIVYALADKSLTSLSEEFWTSNSAQFRISSSVVFGVGWALFVLLSFFVSESTQRHRDAALYWSQVAAFMQMIVRHVVQVFPKGTWHEFDHDRLLGHLLAYPVALKMRLRGEREREQLELFLHPLDVDDVIAADEMHVHCMSVVRSYFACAEPDAHAGFKAGMGNAGAAGRFFALQLVDNSDFAANSVVRIAELRPAYGYVNHLRIFLYLWLFFLPLALIGQSGWFTPLFALLITYGVGMLFIIATNLNDPYGHDVQDLKLNSRAAGAALQALDAYCLEEKGLTSLVKSDHETPRWLEDTDPEPRIDHVGHAGAMATMMHMARRVPTAALKKNVLIPLAIYMAWATGIVFLTWAVAPETRDTSADCRWWCLYLPLDTETTAYVGLGLFLTMGFWLNDAHNRYWAGLQLWYTSMRSALHRLVFQIGFLCKSGTWHERDIERLLSHVAALPYAAKAKLRDSRELGVIRNILSAEDCIALSESTDFPAHCLRVIHAYLNSLDSRDEPTLGSQKRPVNMSMFAMVIAAWDVERDIVTSCSVRKFPISPSFTRHLQVFAVLFLALFPLPLVEHDGFFSLVYLPLVGYSIIKLFDLGNELSDPFGCDHNDVPLDTLCMELKNEVHAIYRETRAGVDSFVHESDYTTERFLPDVREDAESDLDGKGKLEDDEPVTLRILLRKVAAYFPPVSFRVQLLVTIWIFVAVFGSYGLSFAWEKDTRDSDECRTWCSPVDVEQSVPLELGFALFVLLAFRASDAMTRYQEGAQYLHQLGLQLRVLLMEIIQAYEGGTWHKFDKERLAAHFMQIPLYLRSELLDPSMRRNDKNGLLSDADRVACEASADPVRYCIQVIEGYILGLDTPGTEWDYVSAKQGRPSNTLVITKLTRVRQLANSVERIRSIKRFSVVQSYTNHQRLVTGLWLVLLPFSMTATTGFFTLLWAPIVSYGVLALENAATTLADPFGCDANDLPTDKLTTQIVNTLLDSVRSVKWDYHHHTTPSAKDNEAALGSILSGTAVENEFDLPYLSKTEIDAKTFGKSPVAEFRGLKAKKAKPNLISHLLQSAPWWILLTIAAWTTLGVIISYVTRTDSTNERWWESRITIDDMVATYIGFPTFMLLGFYVQAAFSRHAEAGNVWGDHLRAACHTIALQWICWADPGIWHEGDHERVIAHIASIPIVLKMELRGERDVRELAGLLSQQDLGRLMLADSMTTHCVDVIRTYYFSGQCRPDSLIDRGRLITDLRKDFIKFEVQILEEAIRRCKFIATFKIAPAIVVLLRTLLGIWFLLLPFVFAETTGWFSILWVPIVAYGLLGMFSIASELREPFGSDLNDLDLDEMAQSIVRDVLFVYKNHRGAADTLVVKEEHFENVWDVSDDGDAKLDELVPMLDKDDSKQELTARRPLFLTVLHAVPLWMVLLATAWSAVSVGLAWAVNRHWPMVVTDCGPGFCSRIAVDGFVNEFVGFALFLLLGLRLEDSYRRYDGAQTIWREEILGMTRLLSNRLFEAYPAGTFHKGDQERIAAHLAAFSIVTVARLRRRLSSAGCLHEIMSADDARRVESATDKGDYCLDVVRGYLTVADKRRGEGEPTPSGFFAHWNCFIYLRRLQEGAAMCERIIRVPLPFGYVRHIRVFLIIWLGLLPLGLVEFCGWYTVLWVTFIAYGVIGVERWAAELADPFGIDLSDIPLGEFRLKAYNLIKKNLRWYHDGNESVIHPNRPGLPVPQ